MVLNANKTVFLVSILYNMTVFSLWYKSQWIFTSNLKISPSLPIHTLTLYPHQSLFPRTTSPLSE